MELTVLQTILEHYAKTITKWNKNEIKPDYNTERDSNCMFHIFDGKYSRLDPLNVPLLHLFFT